MHKYRLLAAVVTLALVSTVAQAQNKVSLQMNMPVNRTWKMTMSTETAMKFEKNVAGQKKVEEQVITMNMAGRTTPLAVTDGTPTKLKIAFDRDCRGTITVDGKKQDLPFPMAGRTLTMTKVASGDVQIEPAEMSDAEMEKQLGGLMESSKLFSPDHPVGPGDTWEISGAKLSKMFQMTDAKGSVLCRLEQFSNSQGRKAAALTMSSKIAGTMQGSAVTIEMTGPMLIDVATGQTLSSEIKMLMTIKDPANMPFKDSVVSKVKQTNTLAD